jgi:hypothetical protein
MKRPFSTLAGPSLDKDNEGAEDGVKKKVKRTGPWRLLSPGCTEARGDALLELSGNLLVGDAFIIHPGAPTFVRAARPAGAAAALRDKERHRQYCRQGSTGYLFAP